MGGRGYVNGSERRYGGDVWDVVKGGTCVERL